MGRSIRRIIADGAFDHYQAEQDPRGGGNTLHHFGELIFVTFTRILCGVKSYELMQEFCEIRLGWFRKWIDLPNGVPCDNTFARVFEAIDPELFSQCIIRNHWAIENSCRWVLDTLFRADDNQT